MLTAFENGTPQVIVPHSGCCPDQLFNGNRVVSLGCGIMLCPRKVPDTCNTHNEIAGAIVTILQSFSDFNDRCTRWAKKLQPENNEETDTMVVGGLRRLIAGVMLDRQSGHWEGWTETAKIRSINRFPSWLSETVHNTEGETERTRLTNAMKELKLDDGSA